MQFATSEYSNIKDLNAENYMPKDYLAQNDNPQELPEDFEMIRPDQTPTSIKWKLIPMYRTGNNGVLNVWQIGFDGNRIWSLHGPTSKTRITSRQIELNQSGKNFQEQAMQEALKAFKDKYLKGYTVLGSDSPPHVTGMKGYPYQQGKIKKWPAIADVKMDGVRMLATLRNSSVECCSYGNRSYNHMKHIAAQLKEFFIFLPPQCTLDGELYNHEMTFSEVISAVRTVKTFNPESLKVSFFIFDLYWDENPPIEERYRALATAYNRYIEHCPQQCHLRIVPKWFVWNHEQIVESKNYAISQGFEGIVLRRSSVNLTTNSKEWEMSRYKFGRSTRLFKYKDYHDEEGVVIRVESAVGKEEGLAMLILKDQYGFEIPVRIGNNAERRNWYLNHKLIIGEKVTFKHIGRHAVTNVAQQPVGVCIRNYE